jgi:ketosteroid isomerase-like protein
MLLLGRLDEAEARFDESLRALVDCDACIEVARTRVVWGALRRERGDLEGAARHLEAAAAQFAASGAGDELEQARRHLAAAGRISPH